MNMWIKIFILNKKNWIATGIIWASAYIFYGIYHHTYNYDFIQADFKVAFKLWSKMCL